MNEYIKRLDFCIIEIEPFATNNVSTLFSEHISYGLYSHLANSYSCDYIKTTALTAPFCCSFFQNQHFIQLNALTIMQLYHIIKLDKYYILYYIPNII